MGIEIKFAAPKMYLEENESVGVKDGTVQSTYNVASPMELNMMGHKSVSHPLPIPDSCQQAVLPV